jgi:hypothetical protein
MVRGTTLIALLCAALLGGGAPASAASDDAAAEAKRHFEEGTKLFNLGEFGPAAEEYKAAYKAKASSVFLYNVAQALRLNNEPANALFFYRSYLRTTPNASNRREVDKRIKELEALVAAQPEPVKPEPAKPEPEPEPAKVEPAAPVATAAPAATVATPAPERAPLYKKWWLWTAVGAVVVAGVGIGLGVGLSGGGTHAPGSDHGTVLTF